MTEPRDILQQENLQQIGIYSNALTDLSLIEICKHTHDTWPSLDKVELESEKLTGRGVPGKLDLGIIDRFYLKSPSLDHTALSEKLRGNSLRLLELDGGRPSMADIERYLSSFPRLEILLMDLEHLSEEERATLTLKYPQCEFAPVIPPRRSCNSGYYL